MAEVVNETLPDGPVWGPGRAIADGASAGSLVFYGSLARSLGPKFLGLMGSTVWEVCLRGKL